MMAMSSIPEGNSVARDVAVSIRNAYKEYGGGWTLNGKEQPIKVLTGLNMTVGTGTIYGLLGASGCGKSTILKAIVGQHRFTSGEVHVLGSVPGSPGAEVPGPGVGYMPQELGLYGEFTIKETLWYFGRIAGLSREKIAEQSRSVVKLLDLPTHGAPVGDLSGGQQRRVSFAVALLHRPALLILDEPTVGVDPVLRQSIWDHLMDMVRGGRTTVIITTHYIEEARQANTIGLMRQGVLLAQAPPDQLLLRFQCDTLEDVLLVLSRRQEQQQSLQGHEEEMFVTTVAPDNLYHVTSLEESKLSTRSTFWIRFSALVWRNYMWLHRNGWVLGILIIMTLIQSVSFCLSIGRDPVGLPVLVVNQESNCSFSGANYFSGQCNQTESAISCIFIDMLRKRNIDMIPKEDLESAVEVVKAGRSWGVLHFNHNFTEGLYERIRSGRDSPNSVVEASMVDAYMDMTDAMIGQLLRAKMKDTMLDFLQDLFQDCGYPRAAGRLPLYVEQPIYGEKEPQFVDFASPGMLASLVFILSANSAMCSLLPEKRNSIMERQLVTGVKLMEVLYAHYTVQILLMLLQVCLLFLVMFGGFQLNYYGSLWICVVLMIIVGLSGMWFGFLTALYTPNEAAASIVGMSMCLVFMFLASIMWPWEGMHSILRYTSHLLPLTYPVYGLRIMMGRGWGFERTDVQEAFGITILWLIIFFILTHITIKLKKV